jgi:FkbM family methyltransferase
MNYQRQQGSGMVCDVSRSTLSSTSEALLDRWLPWLTANERTTRWLIPWLRAYVRYVPITAGKRWLWTSVINPYFAWHSYPFVARAFFGSRIAGNTRDILQQYVYYFGIWEPHFTYWITRQLRPGDTFIDVGANIGYYSLLASRLVGRSGMVVAIEASPRIFAVLMENLQLNNIQNARAVNIAAGKQVGTARLFLGPETHCGLTTTSEIECAKNDCQFECEISTAPLASILSEKEMNSARLIKIDVEGAEWNVVEGMANRLASSRPDLEVMVELNPQRLADQGKSVGDVLRIFRDEGFYAYQLENDYSAESYLGGGMKQAPLRLRGPIHQETDVLFSRRDAECL